jgi:glyoxylase-like metal-dependent hydrolase (beta-lactamase superfamily II)
LCRRLVSPSTHGEVETVDHDPNAAAPTGVERLFSALSRDRGMSDPEVSRVPVEVDTRAPGGTTNAYVLGTTLVDPAARTNALDAALPERPDHVLLTHTHPDHVGGVEEYADGATVWAHADHRERFVDATGVEPDRTFTDGDRLATDPPLSALATPGHAPDHVAFGLRAVEGVDAPRPAVLVGDLAVAEGSVVVAHPEGDMREYLASLERLRDLDPPVVRLYPGHGSVIDDPRATLQRLIDHRRDREVRVLSAVRAGVETVPEITDAAYEKDLDGVRDLAEATVRAHVEQLAVEGRIRWDGDRARSL